MGSVRQLDSGGGPKPQVTAAAFGLYPKNEPLFALGNSRGSIYFVKAGDPKFQRRTTRDHSGHVTDLSFKPDGTQLASVSKDGAIRLWDVGTGEPVELSESRERRHRTGATAVLFDRSGDLVFSAGQDRTIKVWDATTGHERATLEGHTDTVVALAWSIDRRLLASSGYDRTIRLWDRATYELLPPRLGGVLASPSRGEF